MTDLAINAAIVLVLYGAAIAGLVWTVEIVLDHRAARRPARRVIDGVAEGWTTGASTRVLEKS